MVVAVSHELALIQWTVSRYVYIPETYGVLYRAVSAGVYNSSVTITGVDDLLAVNVSYTSVLSPLLPNTTYEFLIESSIPGVDISQTSETATFTTRVQSKINLELQLCYMFITLHAIYSGAYQLLDDDSPLDFALGADINLAFTAIDIVFDEESMDGFRFIPLFHTPLQEPLITLEGENVVGVRYDRASPSLNGEYVMCGYAPKSEELQCGERLIITVTSEHIVETLFYILV